MRHRLLEPFSDRLFACSTERVGGVSVGHYGGMNLCSYTGDAPEAVQANREAFCAEHGILLSRLVLPRQTHGVEILNVDSSFLELPAQEQEQRLQGVDALITQSRGVCLGIQTADCVPVLLYDAVRDVIGVAHCGWRGTVGRLAAKCALQMGACYGSKPSDLVVSMGPSISAANYPVGEELMEPFEEAQFPIGLLFQRNAESLRFHLDLERAIVWQLKQIGVKGEQMAHCGVCSFGNSERYFSARRLGIADRKSVV